MPLGMKIEYFNIKSIVFEKVDLHLQFLNIDDIPSCLGNLSANHHVLVHLELISF